MRSFGSQLLVLVVLFTLAQAAEAVESAPAATIRFADGAREVVAERLGPAPARDDGRKLTRVRLRYPDLAQPLEALVDHTVVITLDPRWGRADAEAALAKHGVRLERPLMLAAGLWLASGQPDEDGLALAARLREPSARPARLLHALPNLYLRLKRRAAPYVPNDPRFPGQWYFENLAMTEAWEMERGDPNVSIVVVDTGRDLTHPDLVAKLDAGRDVVDSDDDPSYDLAHSGAAHGTACAGLVAAETDNGEGIAGACHHCRLRCIRLLSDVAQPLSASVEAFDFALQVDAAVVSNSWGYVDAIPVPQALALAIVTVYEQGRGGRGALVLFAAGNDDREILSTELQAAEGVFAIGAINNFDEQTPFTNSGASIDVVAPTGTLTTDITGSAGDSPDDYTSTFGGTSSACPVAAGVAGLLVSAAPDLSAGELYDVMVRSARPAPYATPDANGHDLVFGYGIINPPAALRDVLGLPDPEQPDAGAGGGSSTPAAESDDGGCGCRLTPSSSGHEALLGLLALAWLARRRRAR